MRTNPTADTPPALGRLASIVIRYSKYKPFYNAALALQSAIGSIQASPLPPSADPQRRTRYFTPIGKDVDIELRLVYLDEKMDKKGRVSYYYQVNGSFENDAAAADALYHQVDSAMNSSNHTLQVIGKLEADGDPHPMGKGRVRQVDAQRALLADASDENQVGFIVNPPFPLGTPGPPPSPTRLITIVVTVLGLGALLFGGRQLMRRPAAAPLP